MCQHGKPDQGERCADCHTEWYFEDGVRAGYSSMPISEAPSEPAARAAWTSGYDIASLTELVY